MRLKVQLCVLFSTLISLAPMPTLAQETLSTSGQSMQGTWIHQRNDGAGFTLSEVGTFFPDGSYCGTNTNPLHSEHIGVWLRNGDRKFVWTVMFFTHNDKGVFDGVVKVRVYGTMAEDLKSYDSVAERVLMDTSGNELEVRSGIAIRGVRMQVEVPKTDPQE